MIQSVLTLRQKNFLKLFSEKKALSDNFYFTGGTALNEFYVRYRYSEDLDFFSEQEIDLSLVTTFLKSVKKELNYSNFDINTTYNRNLVFLNYKDQTLKLDFTYFPFPQIEKPKLVNGLKVDSVLDIAVNKLFTIYQNPRSRDFMDLYMIIDKKKYSINFLVKQAKVKFDWHVDSLKLGSQFFLCRELKDFPKLLIDLEEKEWQGFFEKEAKNLKKDIIK